MPPKKKPAKKAPTKKKAPLRKVSTAEIAHELTKGLKRKSAAQIMNRAPVARPKSQFSERELALVAEDMESIPGSADTASANADHSDPGAFNDFYRDERPKEGPTQANWVNLTVRVNTQAMQIEVLNRKLQDCMQMINELSVGGGRTRGTANFGL